MIEKLFIVLHVIILHVVKLRIDDELLNSSSTKDQLYEDIKNLGYTGTGHKYNVTDNAIRKWRLAYDKIDN